MASQTMTRKLSFTSPWKSTGGPGTFTYQQPSSSSSASMSATAPQLRNPGDLGPVSMHIRTTETKVPYIGETKNRMEFGSVPKGEYSSPIKMGMHKKSNSDASLRAYNPTHTFHTVYDGPGGATARPNSMSFTQLPMAPEAYLSNTLEVAKPVELVGTGTLATNKFGPGFYRRHPTQISNPRADVIKAHGTEWAARAQTINENRRETLKTTDSKYRYDLITGQPRPYEVRLPVSDKAIGKRIHGEEGLGPEAPHRGNAELRESRVGRFFMPLPGGKNHHYRQDVLAREGLLTEKRSAVLDLSKGELPSYGVEDQFAKSDYLPMSAVASTGLAEVKVIGKFSPRMQPLNPSGDAHLKHTWCRGVDLNCIADLAKKATLRTHEPYQRPPTQHLTAGRFHFDEGLGTIRPET